MSFIFTCSMGDLFHARVGYDFAQRVWQVMTGCVQHSFQVLTKRPERMARFTADHPAPANVWLGTSVEDQRVLHRIEALRSCTASVRFLSCEPLIGPLPLARPGRHLLGDRRGREWPASSPHRSGLGARSA